ncbi:MAG: ATP-binding cassette domain-containing protein, partial [Burkholderiales bacterium]
MAALLQVSKLHAAYGQTRVLHGIDFAMDEGTITTLLGANGAGKTTTLRALCGMVKTQGQVSFAGERLDGKATEDIVRKGIAHVPDGRGTFVNLTTEENLRLGAYVRKDRDAVESDLERVFGYFPRLKERREQQAGTLSGGEQQML